VPEEQAKPALVAATPGVLRLERYAPTQACRWNEFVAGAKNGVFLFHRDYMDYHADRFADHSLLLWQGGRLLALLPANERDGALISHGGLTFGGFITGERMTAALMLEAFSALFDYARVQGWLRIVYKPVPHIYHRVRAEEDLYAIFRCGGRLVRRDLSSTIDIGNRLDLAKGRKWAVNKARKAGVLVRRSDELERFMEIEAENLLARHGVRPTHSAAEMRLLADRFPRNILLCAAYEGPEMLGGTIVYQSAQVAHTQYIATTPRGRDLGALDLILNHLLSEIYGDIRYFDFGISTEEQGRRLNFGLVAHKESYGARAIATDWYELDVAEAAQR
jgi:hypothetical protein